MNIPTIDPRRLCWTGGDDYAIDASELGWPPGFWPFLVKVGPGFGNGQPLVRDTLVGEDKTIYRQDFGTIKLTVWND